jgi:alpha-tubulin suppressor-like RCC1 family protein
MIASASALLLGLLAAACNGEVVGGGQRPARVVVVSGDLQRDTVGKELAQPLVVRVVDERDKPVKNQLVNFVVTAGGGSVFAGSALTNGQGEARERWTLGTVAGDTQRVEARAVDAATGQAIVFETFRAVGVPDVLAGLAAVGPTTRTGTAEDPVADSLAVRAVDKRGNAIAGVQVQWAVVEGGGTLNPAVSATDAGGIARSSWTLGPAVGSQVAQATAAAGAPVSFTATAGALPAVRVEISPRALSFSSLGVSAPITVNAYNRNGAPVPGVPVMIIAENANVVDVTSLPSVVSKAEGTTRVIAAIGNLRDTIPVTVRQVVASLSVEPPGGFDVTVGGEARFVIRPLDANGHFVATPGLAFSSSAPSVATVDATGLVRGVGPGAAEITITAGTISVKRPFRVHQPGLKALAVGAGTDHACVSDDQGRTLCWGRFHESDARRTPVAVGGPRLEKIAGGNQFSCGLTGSGAAYCWGLNGAGQLGNGSKTASSTPVAVSGGRQFTELALGGYFACGLTGDGRAFCWGAGGDGTLGNGQWENASTPQPVSGGHSFTSIAAGDHHACGLVADGSAYCWGLNMSGEVGVAPDRCVTPTQDIIGRSCHNAPVAVSGQVRFRTLALGYDTSCGLAADGAAYCWGNNSYGQIGIGTKGGERTTPTAVAGGHTFRSITSGLYTVCGTTTGGQAVCWGNNGSGQFGNGTRDEPGTTSATPVIVQRGRQFGQLSIGRNHACGIASDGFVYCWGEGSLGHLNDQSLYPQLVIDPG